MHKPLLAALGGTLILTACATTQRDRTPEFVGRTLKVEAANGQVTNLDLRRDGTVIARFGRQETRGTWERERRQLCFTWAGSFRECWPYRRPFEPGRTVNITSSRGNEVRVTLQ